jgi:hypothetical protein
MGLLSNVYRVMGILVKAAGALEANYLPLFNSEVKNGVILSPDGT